MKKFVTLALVIAMISSFAVFPVAAADVNIPANNITETSQNGVSKEADGMYFTEDYSYVGLGNIDLTGINSVEITASNTVSLNQEGDTLWVRIDEPKGKVIGQVSLEEDTNGKEVVFKGSIEATSGTHKVYLMSLRAWKKSAKITNIKFSSAAYEAPKYVPTPDSTIIDDNHTTWALTDILGRQAATYADAGPVREGKYAGIFYHIWHWGGHKTLNYTDVVTEYPDAMKDYYHPAWPNDGATYSHFWNKPLFGYYSNLDYWVYRKHAAMLSAAGIDFVAFDCTNDGVAMNAGYETFFKAIDDAKREGLETPKVVFMNSIRVELENEKIKAKTIYLDIYERGRYSDHWFYWEGKPLLLSYTNGLVGANGDPADEALMQEIKDFFTFRCIRTESYDSGPERDDQWAWLSVYPQFPYGKNPDGTWEMMVVAAAANYSYVHRDIGAMSSPYAMGRSYTDLLGDDKTEYSYLYGYFFQEEFQRLMEVDPEIMFITGWNEWIAGRNKGGAETPVSIVDAFDNNHSRDFEPTSGQGGMKDVYYCLMVDAIRRFKGVEETPLATAPKTIDINNLATWEGVGPAFYNARGTFDRDYRGYNNSNNTNFTARNNVVKSLVARDDINLYFNAECYTDITSPEGDKWMKLYINADRNFATGWEGYDYAVNYPAVGAVSLLASDGTATEIGKAEYVLSGKNLVVKIPRSLIGLEGVMNFEFKWVDNADGEVLNFYVDGNAAPLGRFNYVYTEIKETYLPEETKKALDGVTVVAKNSPVSYVDGRRMYVYEPDTRVTTKEVNGVTYIPAYLLFDAINYRMNYDYTRSMLKLLGEKETYMTIGENTVRVDGRLVYMSNPALIIDGLPYVPITFFNEALGLEIYDSATKVAFGKGINGSLIESVVF